MTDSEARRRAEQIVRNHHVFCIGVWDEHEPYCSCAPEGHPLCEGCQKLADTIEAALSGVSRDEQCHRELQSVRGKIDLVVREVVQRDRWARLSRSAQEAEIRNALYVLLDGISLAEPSEGSRP